MQGVKISQVGRIFASATPSYSRGHHNGHSRKTKEERRIMIESFVEKYKASNKGEFPPVTLTRKVVGGSFYTVREILQSLKQENISCNNLGTELEAIETKNQTRRHTVQPLSLPAESANYGVINKNHSLRLTEAEYLEALSDTEEQEDIIHNDVIGTCDQTQAKQEIKIIEKPLVTSAASIVVGLQPLQEATKGQSISSVSGGVTDNNHSLELNGANYQEALSDTEDQKNIIHNDVMETCGLNDQNHQTQVKQEIQIIEKPLVTSAASIVVGLQPLQEATQGQSISSVSGGVTDNNHSLELNGANYQEALSDTEEKKNIIHNDVIETCGPNDQNHPNQVKQEIKIIEKPLVTSAASIVVGLQPLQEVTKGQSLEKEVKNQPRNFILDENQKNKSTHETEITFQIPETKNVTNRNVMESYSSSVENVKNEASEVNGQEYNLIHEMNSSASISLDACLPELQSYALGSHSLENQNLSGSLEEMEHSLPTHSESGSVFDIQKITSPYSPLERNSSAASIVVGLQPLQEATQGQSISSVSGGVTDNNHSLELNGANYQEGLSDTEEKKNIIPNDVIETCGPNDQNHQTQVKQEIKIIEQPVVTSAASIVLGLQPLQEVTKGQSLEKEVKNQPRNFILDENQKNKSTHETKITFQIPETKNVTNRNVLESYSSSVENVKNEASEVNGQEYNLIHEMNSSASISLDVRLPELQSYALGSHSLENQNLSGSLEEMEHSLPTLSESGSVFDIQKITSPYSPLERNSSHIESSERGEKHLRLDASKPLPLASDSFSTDHATELPKDLSYFADHKEENAIVPNSTKRMPEEPASPADEIISSMIELVPCPGEATEIPEIILEDQKLASSNISPDQVLTGVKAFYGVLLHRLALSALVIQTLVDAADASKKSASVFQSGKSDGNSSSKYCIDLTDKKESTSLAAGPPLDQGGSIRDVMQSTQKNFSDGYYTDNSEKKIGESIGDITQRSQNNSDGNDTDILENKNRTYTNTESFKDPEKLETNIILDFFNNIVKGVFYLLKKQAKKPHGK